MADYKLTARKSAAKFIAAQDAKTRRLIAVKLQRLKADPFDIQHSKPLVGADYRSARVGGLRVLFSVDREARAIVVEVVDSRGQVYQRL